MGKAQLLLGDLDGDLLRLSQAAAILESQDDHAGVAAARIRSAELLLDGGRARQALPLLREAARSERRVERSREQVARLAARRHHLTASALRQLGREQEAAVEERQSSLALTLLPDDDLLDLRRGVALARGADAAAGGRHEEALGWNAQASALARRLGDRLAELAAVTALAADFAALGRVDDALHHQLRALDLAREVASRGSTVIVAQQALALLDTLAPDDVRRAPFEAALAALAREGSP
jgi:tetratricopeptide (TPR) repeat protein